MGGIVAQCMVCGRSMSMLIHPHRKVGTSWGPSFMFVNAAANHRRCCFQVSCWRMVTPVRTTRRQLFSWQLWLECGPLLQDLNSCLYDIQCVAADFGVESMLADMRNIFSEWAWHRLGLRTSDTYLSELYLFPLCVHVPDWEPPHCKFAQDSCSCNVILAASPGTASGSV